MSDSTRHTILVKTATRLGSTLDQHGVAGTIFAALTNLPGIRAGAVAVFDDERDLAECHSFVAADPHAPKAADLTEEETARAQSERPLLDEKADQPVFVDLSQQPPLPRHIVWKDHGVRGVLIVPLRMGGQLVGALSAGFDRPTPPARDEQDFIVSLARIATPAMWTCVTQARFARGDMRRDALITLARQLNSSLQLETVIRCVQPVVVQLPEVSLCAAMLLDENATTLTVCGAPSLFDACALGTDDPTRIPITETPMSWVHRHGCSYHSKDLTEHQDFATDQALRARGTRRYVLVPMLVRDRLIGGLLVGSEDPHPMRKVDLWVYENIALQLGLAIANAQQHEQLQRLSASLKEQNVYLKEEIERTHGASDMIGESEPIAALRRNIAHVAGTDATVLITGETGVGKELVARAIHADSPRRDNPLVKVNCPAIPQSMVESELFGHERGAFTSAVARRIGRFELAHEGTLFLDEIGELPLEIQAKLLRVLQDGAFERVGGSKTIVSNTRIIAATNRDLRQEVEQGTFRSDLFYRLNVFPIQVPSLAQRRTDIPLLVREFVARMSRQTGKRITDIDAHTLDFLCQRDWPGNIRELQHTIERAVILCESPILRMDDATSITPPAPTRTDAAPTVAPLQQAEADHIRIALRQTDGVIEGPSGAAELLDIKPSTLRSRMRRLGIKREPHPG